MNSTRLREAVGVAPLIVSRLAVTGGPDTGKEVISDKERLRVGAHSSNDLILVEDRTASRHHFEIQYTGSST